MLPVPSLDWRRRARLAEAERAAIRLSAGAGEMIWEHRMAEVEGELERYRKSISWRVTKPLRWIAKLLRGGKPKDPGKKPLPTVPGRPTSPAIPTIEEPLSDR